LILRRRQAVPRLPLRLKPAGEGYEANQRYNKTFPAESIHQFSRFSIGLVTSDSAKNAKGVSTERQ
jgi:hypothetical protein